MAGRRPDGAAGPCDPPPLFDAHAELHLDATLFATSFVTVVVIMDPLGNVPIFPSLTRGQTLVQQRRAALLASLGRLLRDYGIDLLSRVMGLFGAAIAVQLVASAVESWVRSGGG
ncbi:MAG TPA: MarC family protein [Acidimicrobiales bacterium]|nr:MarC family protein [Acidimicrobiales bacterium]